MKPGDRILVKQPILTLVGTTKKPLKDKTQPFQGLIFPTVKIQRRRITVSQKLSVPET